MRQCSFAPENSLIIKRTRLIISGHQSKVRRVLLFSVQQLSTFSKLELSVLLDVARRAIKTAVRSGDVYQPEIDGLPTAFAQPGASFVTLHVGGALRGCIGTIEARKALALDVAENAFSAATEDERFYPIVESDFPSLSIHISLLTRLSPIQFLSEKELLRELNVGIDGLVIRDGPYRATFLPVMWERLKTPEQFLRRLKEKAGLQASYWSSTFEASRFYVEQEVTGLFLES